jgi:hypothetical protein
VVYLFAGHGLDRDGAVSLIVDEFDARSKFYKLCNAESKVKAQAAKHNHSMHLAFFACCREIYSNTKHKDGLPGPISAAEACLQARAKAIEEKKMYEANYKSNLDAANAKIKDQQEEIDQLQKSRKEARQNSDDDMADDKPPVQSNEESKDDAARGGVGVTGPRDESYCIVKCSRAGTGVSADTTLIKDIGVGLDTAYDRETLRVRIPDSFAHTKLKDAQLEISTSFNLVPTELPRVSNVVSKGLAYVFVTDRLTGPPDLKLNPIEYKDAE